MSWAWQWPGWKGYVANWELKVLLQPYEAPEVIQCSSGLHCVGRVAESHLNGLVNGDVLRLTELGVPRRIAATIGFTRGIVQEEQPWLGGPAGCWWRLSWIRGRSSSRRGRLRSVGNLAPWRGGGRRAGCCCSSYPVDWICWRRKDNALSERHNAYRCALCTTLLCVHEVQMCSARKVGNSKTKLWIR